MVRTTQAKASPATRSRTRSRHRHEAEQATMQAVRYHLPKRITVDSVPAPTIEDERDIVLKVTSTAICGSDLHIYNGLLPQLKPLTMGHEFMGEVAEVGRRVKRLKVGDRVVVPFPIADGQCHFCALGEQQNCENSNPNYGPGGKLLKEKGGAIFGYTDLYGGYAGGQAEMVRVPFADYGPRLVPDHLKDDEVLFLTDIFPTGYTAIDWAKVKDGETVAVLGCGPVGIMAQKAAHMFGAGQVIGVDVEDYRLKLAKKAGNCVPVHAKKEDVVERIRELTDGRGADVVVDAVGMEPNRSILEKANAVVHGQRGSMKVLRTAFDAVRRSGRVSIVGVYGTTYDNFPLHQVFDKGLKVFAGQARVHATIDKLLEHVERGDVRLDDIITHRLPLADAAKGYRMFNGKSDDCLKVVLKP